MNIESLEAYGSGPFTVKYNNEIFVIENPSNMTYEEIYYCVEKEIGPYNKELNLSKHKGIPAHYFYFQKWVDFYDIPKIEDLQRLFYAVENYAKHIEYDILTLQKLDFVELWKQRQFRKLLNIIDHLPRNSFYSEAISKNVDFAKQVAEHIVNENNKEEISNPPLNTFSPEVSAIYDLIDSVRLLRHTLTQINSKKDVPLPEPVPRPSDALQDQLKIAKDKNRRQKHEQMVSRVLGNRKKS